MTTNPLTPDQSLEQTLFLEFGPYVPLNRAWRFLSYPSAEAARKSFARGSAPLEPIKISGRRGYFVTTASLAKFIGDAFTTGSTAKCDESNSTNLTIRSKA